MKINCVSNNQSPQITFGYDKGLNEKVKHELVSNPSPLSRQLLHLNKLCNETEDQVEFTEKARSESEDGYCDEESDTLLDTFVSLKATFAQAVDRLFPDLNYIKLEAKHYTRAAKGDDESWQHNAADVLNDIADISDDLDEPQKVRLDNYSKGHSESKESVASKYFEVLQVDGPSIKDFNQICAWKN